VSENQPILGVDFGMTAVVAAVVREVGGAPEVVPAERGGIALPAVVNFRDRSRPLVGRGAHQQLLVDPTRTVTGIKRLLGRKASSQAVRDLQARVGFAVEEGHEGQAVLSVEGQTIEVEEVAALLLEQVRRFAERHLGAAPRAAVMAVPAYFNEAQRMSIRKAGELAKLDVVKLVHEPTAVALAYGYDRLDDARVMVVDMGGVRLDVSVLEIAGNVFDVVATGGDPYLGGVNVDSRVAKWISDGIRKRHGKDALTEPKLLQKVRTAAEQAKIELGRCKAVDLQIPYGSGTKNGRPPVATLRLHARVVDELASDVIERAMATIERTLSARNIQPSDIDDVLLAGGATQMAGFRRALEDMFGRPPRAVLPPPAAIALGAALLGDSLRRPTAADGPTFDASLGIALADGRFMPVIERHSRLPITRRVMIPTVRDGQQTVEVDLFVGEGEDIIDVDYLGTIIYPSMPAAEAGESKLVVDLTLDAERVLRLTSPEEGRSGESFEFDLSGYRPGQGPASTFRVARAARR
jgi:molecular chaperone DnaK